VQGEARQLQRWLAIIRERAAYRQAVAADRFCNGIGAGCHSLFDRAHTAYVFLQLSLGMPVGFRDWLGGLLEVMILAQLVWDLRQHALHGQADRPLPIGNHRIDRHRESGRDLTQEVSEVGFAGPAKAAGEQDFTRKTITQDPQHILLRMGVQSVDRQDDVPLLREPLLQTGVIGQAQGNQFLVAGQQVSDGPRGDGDVLVLQRLMNFRDRAVLAVAQTSDVGNHVEAELAMRQGPRTLFLGTVGLMVARTGRIGAADDRHGQAANILKGGDGALGLIKVPQAAAAGRTLLAHGAQAQRSRDRRAFGSTSHWSPS